MPSARSILIVEDEPLIAMMLEDFVEELGHANAGIADTVEGALAHIDRGGFDLAILDVNLGTSECWPVADALAARRIPFVLATGGIVGAIPPVHAGASALAKPFTLDSVRIALESAILRGNSVG